MALLRTRHHGSEHGPALEMAQPGSWSLGRVIAGLAYGPLELAPRDVHLDQRPLDDCLWLVGLVYL